MFVGYRLVSNQNSEAARLSIAPMMDWTDRHCRFFHRLICQQVLLYTEMITATSLVRGSALHLLDYSLEEHPVALQLGGCDPVELASAAKIGQELIVRLRPDNFFQMRLHLKFSTLSSN